MKIILLSAFLCLTDVICFAQVKSTYQYDTNGNVVSRKSPKVSRLKSKASNVVSDIVIHYVNKLQVFCLKIITFWHKKSRALQKARLFNLRRLIICPNLQKSTGAVRECRQRLEFSSVCKH